MAQAPQGKLPQPPKDWQAQRGASGETYWQWRGRGIPSWVDLDEAPARPLPVALSYRSAQAPSGQLPVQISRRLLRLVPGEGRSSSRSRRSATSRFPATNCISTK